MFVVAPQPPKKDFIKMLENDGKILRFAAVMVMLLAQLSLYITIHVTSRLSLIGKGL